jgi:hypothetical protein
MTFRVAGILVLSGAMLLMLLYLVAFIAFYATAESALDDKSKRQFKWVIFPNRSVYEVFRPAMHVYRLLYSDSNTEFSFRGP